VPRGLAEKELKEKILADEKIRNYAGKDAVKKWVIIPDKLVNIVISS